MHYVYIIQNKLNNKIYVGQTINPQKRWRAHVSAANKNPQMIISKAIAKYGKSNFDFSIIESMKDIDHCNETEEFYINYFSTLNRSFGYNQIPGGKNCKRGKMSLERLIVHKNNLPKGQNHHGAIFNENEILLIRKNFLLGTTVSALAKKYECRYYVIQRIVLNKTYYDPLYAVNDDLINKVKNTAKLERKNSIIRHRNKDYTLQDDKGNEYDSIATAAIAFNISPKSLGRILSGKRPGSKIKLTKIRTQPPLK